MAPPRSTSPILQAARACAEVSQSHALPDLDERRMPSSVPDTGRSQDRHAVEPGSKTLMAADAVGTVHPNQLLASAYASCFHGALAYCAARLGLTLEDSSVDVVVATTRDPSDGFPSFTANVRVSLPGVERNVADALIRSANDACPYAKLFRQGIVHTVVLADREPDHQDQKE